MSSYKELEKEFKEKVEELRKRCKHEELSDWKEYTDDNILHQQILETKSCKRCELLIITRTKCPQCEKYVDIKDWIEVWVEVYEKGGLFFKSIEIAAYMYFCSEKCVKDYRYSIKEKNKEIEIEPIKKILRKIGGGY